MPEGPFSQIRAHMICNVVSVFPWCGSDIGCKLCHVMRKAALREQQKPPLILRFLSVWSGPLFLCFGIYICYASSRLQLDFARSDMGYRVRVPCDIQTSNCITQMGLVGSKTYLRLFPTRKNSSKSAPLHIPFWNILT